MDEVIFSLRHFDITGFCIFLIALALASVGFSTYFMFDDYIYLHLAEEHASSIKTFFEPFWTFTPWLFYRPLPSIFWIALFALFGASPTPYEIGVILTFAAMVFFIYRLGHLLGGRIAGLVAGLLVALYFPIYSVSWVRFSSSLQMELFFLASGMFYLARWVKPQSNSHSPRSLPWLGIALMIGAFLSKETSFMAPLLLPLLAPKRRVVKLAAGLFASGAGLFFLARNLIPSRFPLPVPRLDLTLIVKNLEFFLREQFLFYLPASLIVLAALAWGGKNRHVYLLLCVLVFLLINLLVGYTVTTHRAKLAVCLATLVYCVINAPAKVRFLLAWTTLLLLPPLSVLDTTTHQSAEAFMGLALFLGVGVARQTRLVMRIGRSIVRAFSWRRKRPEGTADSLCERTLDRREGLARLRIVGVLACALLLVYAAYTILSLNLRIGVAKAQEVVHTSRLTKDVREYLCSLPASGLRIHAANLPGLISVPDIQFDAQLHGCRLLVDEHLSARRGIFLLTGETPKGIMDDVSSHSRLIKRLSRGRYEALVFISP